MKQSQRSWFSGEGNEPATNVGVNEHFAVVTALWDGGPEPFPLQKRRNITITGCKRYIHES